MADAMVEMDDRNSLNTVGARRRVCNYLTPYLKRIRFTLHSLQSDGSSGPFHPLGPHLTPGAAMKALVGASFPPPLSAYRAL